MSSPSNWVTENLRLEVIDDLLNRAGEFGIDGVLKVQDEEFRDICIFKYGVDGVSYHILGDVILQSFPNNVSYHCRYLLKKFLPF